MPSLNIIGNVNLTGGKYNKAPFQAIGGIVNTFVSGGVTYKSHTYISGSNGTFQVIGGEITAQVLVVGGGGGGEQGGAINADANGGGGGGLIYSGSYFLKRNPLGGDSIWTVSVGLGGEGGFPPTTPPNVGTTSSFIANFGGYEQITPIIAQGGGPGEGNGASGGGHGLAIYGSQGNNGGTTEQAGGGGAGAVGADSVAQAGGNGGDGLAFTLYDGTSRFYAGGGGGGGYVDTSKGGGTGGQGGGGTGGSGVSGAGADGTPNTGGGAGGGVTANNAGQRGNGGDGGSGVVIITYPLG